MPPSAIGPSSPTEPTRLRQVAFVSADLERERHLFTKVLGTEVIFRDPRISMWGLENFLVPIGGDVLEVVSPIQPNTSAGRFLSKRGGTPGGYMLIMQTGNAKARRAAIEANGLGKVIYSSEAPGHSVCIQYHPKTAKGGVIPELDAHEPTAAFPDPVAAAFSPWHALHLPHEAYLPAMKRTAHLQISGVQCRLEPGDEGVEEAARQWRDVFGVPMSRDLVAFTNARLGFLRGAVGKKPGLERITIAVKGRKRFDRILAAAREEGVYGDGKVNMCGVEWYFEYVGEPAENSML